MLGSACCTIPASSFAFTVNSPVAKVSRGWRYDGHHSPLRASSALTMNFFSDLGDMMTGGNLEACETLPYEPPFCSDTSRCDEIRVFAIKERPISFTGEDFDVANADGSDFIRVRGAMLHLPGKDKMKIKSAGSGEELVVLDRKLISATPTYDIFRGGMGAEKIGWIEKKFISMTDTFDVYMEGKGGFGVTGLFKPDPAFRITGDFLDRNWIMKNEEGKTVARVCQDGLIQFDAWNHYQVQVAPGMDAVLVIACACAIDEELDEEHQESSYLIYFFF